MEWITLLLVTAVLWLLYRYFLPSRNESGIPGPKKYPIVGSALQLKQDKFPLQFSEFAQKHGDLFEIHLFGTINIVLNTCDIANKAFGGELFKEVLNDRPPLYISEALYPGYGVVLMNPGHDHNDMRKLLAKGLHVYGDGIPQFENVIKSEIQSVLKQIELADGDPIEVVPLMRRSVCNVISILLIGEEATEDDYSSMIGMVTLNESLANPIHNTLLLSFPVLRHSPVYKDRVDKAFQNKDNVLDKMFHRTKETRTPGTIRGLVDWYLEEQEREEDKGESALLTDDAIKANIMDIISAGILTTSTVLINTILILINHVDYQKRIQEEIDRVIGHEREPSIFDRRSCDLLEATIIEIMRYATPVPLSVPHVCSSDVQFESFEVKAGTQLLTNIWHMHHDDNVWGDPWVFRPERFLDENGKLLPNSHTKMKCMMPFGTGRRKCLGIGLANNRLFLYISHLLQKWTFLQAGDEGWTCDPRENNYNFNMLCTAKPFKCIATKRK